MTRQTHAIAPKQVSAFDVDLALQVIERYAERLDTSSDACGHCGLIKFRDFSDAKSHETLTSAVRKIRSAKADVERRRKTKRG